MACVHKWQNHKDKYCYPKIICMIFIIQCVYLSLAWAHITKCYTNRRIRKTVPRFLGTDTWVWRRGRVLHFLCSFQEGSVGMFWWLTSIQCYTVVCIWCIRWWSWEDLEKNERRGIVAEIYCGNTYQGILFCTVKNSNATEGKHTNGQKYGVCITWENELRHVYVWVFDTTSLQ